MNISNAGSFLRNYKFKFDDCLALSFQKYLSHYLNIMFGNRLLLMKLKTKERNDKLTSKYRDAIVQRIK